MVTHEEVDEYLQRAVFYDPGIKANRKKATEAAADDAYVAVFIYYRMAVDTAYNNLTKASLLYLALDHAKKLKKDSDKAAVVEWIENVIQPMPSGKDLIDRLLGTKPPETNLIEIIRQEISRGNYKN